MKILHICANPRPIAESASKQLAAAFFAKLAEINPDIEVTNVDLYHSPPPYLSYDAYRCIWLPVRQPGYEATDAEKKAGAYGRNQAETLKEADILVLTMPLWNAGMPAIMKAWFDQVMVPGVIFDYDAAGVTPLHQIKKVVLLVSSGAALKEGDLGDALTPMATAIMQFIGVTDIVSAWADGQDPVMNADCDMRKKLAVEAAQELAEEVAELAKAAT